MKTLIVEKDAVSSKIMQLLLAPYGRCDIAVSGKEALVAFQKAAREGARYDLICIDVVLPGMDGISAVKEIRHMEEEAGIRGKQGVKIIMTTALHHSSNTLKALNSQCETYLVKPIGKRKLLKQLHLLRLVE